MYLNEAKVEAEVREAMSAYISAVLSRKVEEIMAWFVPEPGVTVVMGAQILQGLEAIREGYFSRVFGIVPDDQWMPGELIIRTLGPGAAYVTYPYVATGTVQGKPFRVEGMGTNAWVRTAEGWRVAHEHCHVNKQA